jgi:hypothetical protein
MRAWQINNRWSESLRISIGSADRRLPAWFPVQSGPDKISVAKIDRNEAAKCLVNLCR